MPVVGRVSTGRGRRWRAASALRPATRRTGHPALLTNPANWLLYGVQPDRAKPGLAILTRRYEPGEKLPSQPDLAAHYGVARETVKAALRALVSERLVVIRRGSSACVRARTERPVGLRPHIEAAFDRPQVTIDFAGFSGETLHGALAEPLDKIRLGRLTPESVAVRILLPDLTVPAVIPSRTEGGDDPAVRERAIRIGQRHTKAILESVRELGDLGLVRAASAEVRVHGTAPLFKLYILNGEEAFFGFYPVVRHPVAVKGETVPIFDVMGKDATLFHFAAGDDDTSNGPQYVEQACAWFDSVWTTIAREYQW